MRLELSNHTIATNKRTRRALKREMQSRQLSLFPFENVELSCFNVRMCHDGNCEACRYWQPLIIKG